MMSKIVWTLIFIAWSSVIIYIVFFIELPMQELMLEPLTINTSNIEPGCQVKMYQILGNNINIRTGPGLDYEVKRVYGVLQKLKYPDTVLQVCQEGVWSKIRFTFSIYDDRGVSTRYETYEGWILNSFLKEVDMP